MSRHYEQGFHGLLADAGLLTQEDFAVYYEDVIGANNSTALKLDGFVHEEEMQLDFDYDQLQVEGHVGVMAQYVDEDAEAIPLGTKDFEIFKGSIPTQKARFIMTKNDYRKYLIKRSQLAYMGQTVQDYALNILFEKLSAINDSHKNSYTFQRDSMVSRGMLSLLDTNNTGAGIVGLQFTAKIPDKNFMTKTGTDRWFTDAEKTKEGTTSNPPKDVKTILRKLKREMDGPYHIEVDDVSFFEDIEHSKWKEALGRTINRTLEQNGSGAAIAIGLAESMNDDGIKAAFRTFVGVDVPVVFSTSVVAVEKYDKKTKKLSRPQMRSFAANTYAIIPDGTIGTIKTVAPLTLDKTCLYGQLFDGRGLIKYTFNADTEMQQFKSELTTLCVPNRSQDMYYLITGTPAPTA